VAGNLIYLALMAVVQFIPLVGYIANPIIGGPLLLGVTYFFLALSRKQEAALSQIFDGLQRFVDALITYLLMALFIFLWSLLLIIPGIMAALSYALTFYLVAENPGLKGMEALQRSKTLMNGYRWKMFCLFLRFFGWFLLGALTMGIGFLWIMPYLQTAMARFYDDLRLAVIKIGRAGDNHLAFPQEKAISGHHCEIFREGKNFFIRDLGSTNGVFVNSRKVETAPLTEGDEIKLGGKVFSFTRSG
jgi:uncharacterized membrane protein